MISPTRAKRMLTDRIVDTILRIVWFVVRGIFHVVRHTKVEEAPLGFCLSFRYLSSTAVCSCRRIGVSLEIYRQAFGSKGQINFLRLNVDWLTISRVEKIFSPQDTRRSACAVPGGFRGLAFTDLSSALKAKRSPILIKNWRPLILSNRDGILRAGPVERRFIRSQTIFFER